MPIYLNIEGKAEWLIKNHNKSFILITFLSLTCNQKTKECCLKYSKDSGLSKNEHQEAKNKLIELGLIEFLDEKKEKVRITNSDVFLVTEEDLKLQN